MLIKKEIIMKQIRLSKEILLCIPLIVILVFSFVLSYWVTSNSNVQAYNKSNEFASDKNPARMCLPANLPIDLTIDLLNDPQASGDMAFFEVKFTSRIKHDGLKAYLVLPDGTIRESGEDEWEGLLELNESKQLDTGIRLNTEDAVSLKAIVEITRGDTSFYVGKSFYIDLGEKEYASLEDLTISGFSGADKLNLIVPKP